MKFKIFISLLLLIQTFELMAVDISKFVTNVDGETNKLSINIDATGNELNRLYFEVKDANTGSVVWSKTDTFSNTDSISRTQYYTLEYPGTFLVTGQAFDVRDDRDSKTKVMLVPNRPPEKPTIVLSNYSPEMGGSINITGQTSDLDRNLGQARIVLKRPDGSEIPIAEQTVANQEFYEFSTTHTFEYVNPASFGTYQICNEIMDQSGALVRSDWVSLSPSNPTKTMTIYTQARAEGEMAKWYEHSNVVSKTVTVRKYAQ